MGQPQRSTINHLEGYLEGVFSSEVRKFGGVAIKLIPVTAGIPDRLAIFPSGEFYLVELKTSTGQKSPIQEVWHERLADMGVRVITLHGRDEILSWVRRGRFLSREQVEEDVI